MLGGPEGVKVVCNMGGNKFGKGPLGMDSWGIALGDNGSERVSIFVNFDLGKDNGGSAMWGWLARFC